MTPEINLATLSEREKYILESVFLFAISDAQFSITPEHRNEIHELYSKMFSGGEFHEIYERLFGNKQKKAPAGGNRARGGERQKALQNYEITETGRTTIRVEGAEHHFDLKRVFEYCHTPDGTLSFRAIGTPQRRFTGKLATDLHAALRQWYGMEERTAGND